MFSWIKYSILKWVNIAPLYWCVRCRRQELRELRLLQKEEHRAQQQLSNKLQQQREQIYRRFEQETAVSQSGWATVLWCISFFFFTYCFVLCQLLGNKLVHLKAELNLMQVFTWNMQYAFFFNQLIFTISETFVSIKCEKKTQFKIQYK